MLGLPLKEFRYKKPGDWDSPPADNDPTPPKERPVVPPAPSGPTEGEVILVIKTLVVIAGVVGFLIFLWTQA
jgi:hypothetical protein